MYKLIAVDLDGTLLDENKGIHEDDKAALAYAVEKGITVVVCSGRIFKGAGFYAKDLGLQGPVIACNGAIIRDLATGKDLYMQLLGMQQCLEIIALCRRENIYFHAYAGDVMYSEKLEHSTLFYWNKNQQLSPGDRVDIHITDSVADKLLELKAVPSKIVVISDDAEKLAHVRKGVSDITGVAVMSSGRNNFEVMDAAVSKGAALQFLTDRIGIAREEVIAVGDNENDESMIRFAGIGIAMGNAEESLKAVADFVTLPNTSQGVAYAIKKFLY